MAQRRKTAKKSASKAKSAENLVIVESGTKAQTIKRYLGRGYEVLASVGHVRDLPEGRLGIDVDNEFEPTYVVPRDKQPIVSQIKRAAAGSKNVLLATDPDREGEAIAWHLMRAANLDAEKTSRIVFNEITEPAITAAVANPRSVNGDLVDAQQARRVLDRLVGFKISPILRRHVAGGRSAGRVQSVALKIVVERERERRAFVPKTWWTVDGQFGPPEASAAAFGGILYEEGEELQLDDEASAAAMLERLTAADYQVAGKRIRDRKLRPQAPFATASLQRAASNRLGFSPSRTMRVAQRLYEGVRIAGRGQIGLITYMRTDSVNVSAQAIAAARAMISSEYGADALPDKPNFYRTKSRNAQEAHEAVRPTDVGLMPKSLGGELDSDQWRLYELIWRQFVASQMTPATQRRVSVDIGSAALPQGRLFRAGASRVVVPGHLLVASYGPAITDRESSEYDSLIDLNGGQATKLFGVATQDHTTQPPGRYTEAGLIRVLEEEGIGRPSTYAAIIRKIKERDYVRAERRILIPTEIGEKVTDAMGEFFADIVDTAFTARMETELDRVSRGELGWVAATGEFWERLEGDLSKARENAPKPKELGEECPECGKGLVQRVGRNGEFVGCSGYPKCRYTRNIGGEEVEAKSELVGEECPECSTPLEYKEGRFGRFIGCGDYPTCRYTRQIVESTGVACPKCEKGEIAIKKSRRGRTFYGCQRYPECDYSSWTDPRRSAPSKPKPAAKSSPNGAEPAKEAAAKVGECPRCGKDLNIKKGRWGEFIGCSGFPKCRFTGKTVDYPAAG